MPADRHALSTRSPASRARQHFARARRRILFLRARRGAIEGAIVGLGLAALLSPRILTSSFEIESWKARLIAQATILFGVLAGVFVSGLFGGRRGRFDRVWERALRDSAGEKSSEGLVIAVRALLDSDRREFTPFEQLLVTRFNALPLPEGASLARALPGTVRNGALAALVLFGCAFWIGRDLPATPLAASPGPSAEFGGTPPARVGGAARTEEIEALRRELAVREELARLLDGSVALEILAESLRAGGTFPPLEALTAFDRERLTRVATRATALGAPAEWIDAFEAAATGTPDGAPPALEWENVGAQLAAAATDWIRATSIEGTASISVPDFGDGGSAGGALGAPPTEGTVDPTPSADGGASPSIDLPPGLPIAEGRDRRGSIVPADRAAEVDPSASWLRRSELEPHWFPVIEAYRRQESSR